MEAAFEEARALGHDSLGDEDLLLGILRADEGTGAEALFSLGVTLEAAREESEELLSAALYSIGISFEEVRRESGDAFEMRIPDDRKIPYSPGPRTCWCGRARRCEGWATTTSAPSTSSSARSTTSTACPCGYSPVSGYRPRSSNTG